MRHKKELDSTPDGLTRRTAFLVPDASSGVQVRECLNCGYILDPSGECPLCQCPEANLRIVYPSNGARTNQDWCKKVVAQYHTHGIPARVEAQPGGSGAKKVGTIAVYAGGEWLG